MSTQRNGGLAGLADVHAQANVFLPEIIGWNGVYKAVSTKKALSEEDAAAPSADSQKHHHQKQSSRSSILRHSSFSMKGTPNPTTSIVESAILPNQKNRISRRASTDGHHRHSSARSGSNLKNKDVADSYTFHEPAAIASKGTGTSSIFGSASSKLKGYLKSHKKQQSLQDSHGISGFDTAKGGYVSDTKGHRHRSSLELDNSHATGKKSSKSSDDTIRRSSAPDFGRGRMGVYNDFEDVLRYAKLSSNQSCASGMDETAVSSYSIKTKYSTSLYDVASVQSKGSAKKKHEKTIVSSDSIVVQVFDLPWTDHRPGSNLQGRYFGPVDELLQPNGKGTVILRGNETLQFQGVFEHGSLMSHLTCDKERPPPTISTRVETRNSVSSIGSSKTGRAPKEPPGRTVEHSSSEFVQRKKADKQKLARDTPHPQRRVSNSSSHDQVNVPSTSGSDRRDKEVPPFPSSQAFDRQNSNRRPTKSKQRYSLGDVASTPKHMIIHRSNTEAIHSASLLKQYEQAFLKRSNGLWTVAILADRSLQPVKRDSSHWYSEWEIDSTTMELEESMLFVINEHGATKTVQRKHWGKFVRRMNIHEIEQAINEKGTEKCSSA
ncbi:hypothetical protein HJC23_001099 [Cyclotella cryptica]|uniref:Uncharacterized protein n=1 Tax=Cyclotella cryptica TaxID=29204 RepID=A0ABD3QIB6_9STRA|eukprot:CCRYP_005077-RA/>CCRYP_005077-RA protein AED:0.15 eAED:0.15 QI:299/1/1/1/0/0/2/307/604